jgi:hypothetical protein
LELRLGTQLGFRLHDWSRLSLRSFDHGQVVKDRRLSYR